MRKNWIFYDDRGWDQIIINTVSRTSLSHVSAYDTAMTVWISLLASDKPFCKDSRKSLLGRTQQEQVTTIVGQSERGQRSSFCAHAEIGAFLSQCVCEMVLMVVPSLSGHFGKCAPALNRDLDDT